MVAYGRDNGGICENLGADRVVFQTLDDVTKACAEVPKSIGQKEPETFEVGVFCGRYATPIPTGYFDQLKGIRGEKWALGTSSELPEDEVV